MVNAFENISKKHVRRFVVASPGIEPGSGASETLILSIVLRGQKTKTIELLYYPRPNGFIRAGPSERIHPGGHCTTRPKELNRLLVGYLISPGALLANIFTAMASKITPKNFLTAVNPPVPNNLAI
jgi:hypothetical protein